MKTSNKTHREVLRIAIILMVLSLVTVNLYSQKSVNLYTLAGLHNSLYNYSFETIKNLHETKVHTSNVNEGDSMEEWMSKPKEWSVSSMKEDELILESWMVNPSEWNSESNIEKFTEKEMELEPWMTRVIGKDESEKELEMEKWMLEVWK